MLTEECNAAGAEPDPRGAGRVRRPLAPARRRGVEERRLRRRGRPGRRCPQRRGDPVDGHRRRGRPRRHHRRVARPSCARRSARTAPSPPAPPRRSPTAPRRRGDEQGQGRGARPRVARRDRRARPGRRPRLDPAAAAGQRDREGLRRRRASARPTSTWSSSTRRSPRSASRRPASSASPEDKVNVNGGAIALGHPVGMSGARIVLHLALELKRRGGGIGAAALCGGGGQGDALIVRVSRERGPTSSVDDLVARARAGEARAVARLISLVEDDVAAAARGDGGAGAARRPRPGRRHHRLAGRRQVDLDQRAGHASCARPDKRVGVLAVDPSSPFSGGALLGDRVRMQDHALDHGVYIRSMASRGHLGGLSWTTPQALRVLDAAGCDVVLVETVGVGQSEVEIAGAGRHHAGAAGARAWATASRPPRPGSSRSATSTSSTRPTATAPTRSAATCAR